MKPFVNQKIKFSNYDIEFNLNINNFCKIFSYNLEENKTIKKQDKLRLKKILLIYNRG